jgi:hypothetical protein
MEMAAQAREFLEAPGHVAGLRLDFLHANTIGARLVQPGFQPLAVAERCR